MFRVEAVAFSRHILAAAFSLALWSCAFAADNPALDPARQAFAKGDYNKAIEVLKAAVESDPNNSDLHVLLSRCYLQLDQYDAAVSAGEKAVALSPNNSEFHRVLGEAYGGKADHASKLSAFGLARKTQKEFETATQLDPHNFEAMQNLIEYDCTAPGIVGGGEEKAQPLVEKLMGMDAAEGHDAEFSKALELKPKTAKRIYDIGDYFLERRNAAQLLAVANAGEQLVPQDPRGKFYRGGAFFLQDQKPADAEKLPRAYLQTAPGIADYPPPWTAHDSLGS